MRFVRIRERVEIAPRVVDFEQQHEVGVAQERLLQRRAVEVVSVREVHAAAEIDHGCTERFGELDHQADAGLRAHRAVGEDHGFGGGDQHFCRFAQRRRITLRLSDPRDPGDAQFAGVLDRVFLQIHVDAHDHRFHRRSHRVLVGAHG